jgi:hypothetical protein
MARKNLVPLSCNLSGAKSAVQHGYLPSQAPGVRLTLAFFQRNGIWWQTYPRAKGLWKCRYVPDKN